MNEAFADVDVLTDFQLQIEHILDLENRQRVLFVDASVSAGTPFEFYQLQAEQDASYTTHAMSPQSLLAVYEKVNKRTAPPSFMLSVRGYQFDLGSPLSAEAVVNLSEAIGFIRQRLDKNTSKDWTENQHVSDRC